MTSVFQRRRNSRWTQDDTPNSNNGNPGSSPGNPTLPLQTVTGLARRNTNDNFFPQEELGMYKLPRLADWVNQG